MAQCDECGCYDDNWAESIDYPEGIGDDDVSHLYDKLFREYNKEVSNGKTF